MLDEAYQRFASDINLKTQFGLFAKRRPLYESLICESVILNYDVGFERSNFGLTLIFLVLST